APSGVAASPTRIARPSARASRSAMPLFSIDWLPAVSPSFGIRSVSPEIICTRSSGRSSSSAAICASAVTMPWPSSTLPVQTVALPFTLIWIQASSLRLVSRLPGSFAGCCASTTCGSSENASSRPPAPAVKARREMTGAVISGPPHGVGGAQHGADDAVVGAAAAQVGGEALAHLGIGRMRVAVEQRFCTHQHAVDAVAALGGLLVDEGLLQRMRLLHAAEPLDGGDLGRAELADRRHAGAHRRSVDQDGAGAALRQAAAEFCAVESEVVAQHIE